jgi:hypothetical protein
MQGRHHLRQGGMHRIQWPRRQSRRPACAREGACLRPSAAPGAAIRPMSTTRPAPPLWAPQSGSAVSVSANLVMASLGEETRASTRGPANHNACALMMALSSSDKIEQLERTGLSRVRRRLPAGERRIRTLGPP